MNYIFLKFEIKYIFLRNTKKQKADKKIATLSVFKKSYKDEKRLKYIKESKEGYKIRLKVFGKYK